MDLKSFLSTVNKDSLVGLSAPVFIPEEGSAIIGYYSPPIGEGHFQIPANELESAAEQLYTARHFPLAIHGLKRMREVYRLRDLGPAPQRVWDTRLMAHLLDPDRDDDHGYRLSALVKECLDQDYPYRGERLFASDHPEFLHQCLEKDAELVHGLAGALSQKMDEDLLRLYPEVELPVSSVLVQMHLDGIPVDRVACGKLLQTVRDELDEVELQLDLGSRNLFSARQTYWFLHDAGVQFHEDIGRGFKIDDDDLKELADNHGIALARQILRWRKLKRDLGFLEKGAAGDRVHPVWRMTRTSTGRIVASDPPVQNIDKKKYRPLLMAKPGRTLIKADWKTCQTRILAHLSGDPELIRLFVEGEDLHTRTAQMLGLGRRDEAKPINFGIIFGQGARALAREINGSWKEQGRPGRVNEPQAEEYIETFFATYKGILPYFKAEYEKLTGREISERVLKNPVTGRIRRFPKQRSDKLMREMKATLLQQVESHLLKVSLVRLSKEISRRDLDARIVVCIHDSIWIETAAEEESEVRKTVTEVMTTAVDLDVPLEVDFS
ncbi:DNA polymerase [Thermodesulfobacteriota bacterium]